MSRAFAAAPFTRALGSQRPTRRLRDRPARPPIRQRRSSLRTQRMGLMLLTDKRWWRSLMDCEAVDTFNDGCVGMRTMTEDAGQACERGPGLVVACNSESHVAAGASRLAPTARFATSSVSTILSNRQRKSGKSNWAGLVSRSGRPRPLVSARTPEEAVILRVATHAELCSMLPQRRAAPGRCVYDRLAACRAFARAHADDTGRNR